MNRNSRGSHTRDSSRGPENSRGRGRSERNRGNNSGRGRRNNNNGGLDDSPDTGRSNDSRREFVVRRMPFKQAETLSNNDDVEEVVQKVFNDRSGFKLVLEDNELSGDWICLIAHILSKVSRSSFQTTKLKIYKDIFANSSFAKQLKAFVVGLPYQDDREKRGNSFFWRDSDKFWMDLIEIFKDIITTPTFAGETLPTLLKAIVNNLPTLEEEQSMHISEGRSNDSRREFVVRRMPFKQAETLSNNDDVEEVVQKVFNDRSGFKLVLEDNELSGDWICLIAHILSKVSRSSFQTTKLKIYKDIFANSSFAKQLKAFVVGLPYQDDREKRGNSFFWRDSDKFWMDLIEIFKDIITTPTFAGETLPTLLKAIVNNLPTLEEEQSMHISEGIKTEFLALKIKVEDMKQTMKDRYQSQQTTHSNNYREQEDNWIPPEDFRTISVLPNVQEVTCKETPFLRCNKLKGSYKSIDHYLDVQFRLLREDFVKPLRDGICQFLENPTQKRYDNIKIHPKVHFLSEENINELKCFRIKFDFSKKTRALKFENSKQFMFGSLVCLTRDKFVNLLFAKIVKRDADMIKKGELVIGFDDNNNTDLNIIFNVDYIMVESKVYFEPYYHVLMAMQRMSNEKFPMQDYIIFGNSRVHQPEYMVGDNVYLRDWRVIRDLNGSQATAFRAALSQEISVIQGPPGTGKTFLGLKIADTLLRNKEAWFNHTPMLVICYTNHALDQFLEGIAKSTERLLRIGGQSKNENLQKFSLKNKKKGKKNPSFYQAQRELNVSLNSLKVCDSMINEVRQYKGILDFACFKHLINENDRGSHWYATASKEEIKQWLFEGSRGYVPPPPASQPAQPRKDLNYLSSDEDDELTDFSEDEEEVEDEDFVRMLSIFGTHRISNIQYSVTVDSISKKILEQKNTITIRGGQANDNILRQLQNEMLFLETKMNDLRNNRIPPIYSRVIYNFHELNHNQRWSVYSFFVKQYLSHLIEEREKINKVYQEKYVIYMEQRDMEDVKLMRDSLVIGMTTTSAARLRSTLNALKSPIVIVEEAAEVLEAHLIGALTVHCQQLILIGDHQQLRPTTADYKVETHYQMGVSLFERLVRNDVQCHTLNVQHRMRSEICSLIRPAIYAKLEDHESVLGRENIKGMNKNLFFLTHSNKEESCGDSTKKNLHEAKLLINLAKHLILNGYKPNQITILAAYLGQMFEMQRERKKNSLVLRDVRISVLDNYQGEESDIILLSLVRNNAEMKNGFLKNTNRVCVALSRARNGLYIMGNIQQLCNDRESIWHQIKGKLVEQGALGETLELRCQIHDVITKVKKDEDFNKSPEGGCLRPCNASLPNCSHFCKIICHLENRSHEGYKCMEACGRSLCTRKPEKHICTLRCFEKCPPCYYLVGWTLHCGHQVTLPCHQDPNTHKCVEPVLTLLPCGHKEMKPCHVRPEDFACPVDCKATLDCGHVCMLSCHDRRDPDHLSYKCPKPCARVRGGCSTKEHSCRKFCYEECEPCTEQVMKHRTICTHVFKVACNSNVDTLICEKPCNRTLPCGHQCKKKCCDACGPCEVKVEKVIASCGHKVTVRCCQKPSRQDCREKCQRMLACGHACVELCKMACTEKCEEMVACQRNSPCGHVIGRIKCFEQGLPLDVQVLLKYCSVPCLVTLQCEHKCGGTCGQCFQGRMHARCQERCGVPMVCNHECPIPCREACRPCEKKCTYKCDHSHCTKKCGEVCVPCAEKCSRKCPHQKCDRKCSDICLVKPCTKPCPEKLICRHQCVGFCGDPCPKLCRVCNREELTEILFGTEDEEDARFVLLIDCGHVLESSGMETWLKGENEAEIQVKVCPKCKTPIINTQRYSEYLKKAMVDIQNVKKRLNGSPEANREMRVQLLTRILLLKQHRISKFSILFSSALRETESRLEETKWDVERGRVRQSFNAVILNSITSKVQILEHIAIISVSGTDSPEVQAQLSFILDCIQRNEVHVTNQEIDDIQMEISRLKRMVELTQIKQHVPSLNRRILSMFKRPSVTPAARIQHIEKLVNTRNRYTKAIDESVQEMMKTLESGIKISESERVEIVQALGLKQGHWFKCPNGHPYIITECGGAMQEYTCPEAGCGEKIGGTHHTLIGTNQLASEMDGARFAAWSNMANNLGNYDIPM